MIELIILVIYFFNVTNITNNLVKDFEYFLRILYDLFIRTQNYIEK